MANYPAIRSKLPILSFHEFRLEKTAADATVNMIPGKNLIYSTYPGCIKIRGNVVSVKRVHPNIVIKLILPGIKLSPFSPCCFDHV